MSVIQLRLGNGTADVEAKVYGVWGVHKDGHGYTVTHTPSGMYVRTSIPKQRDALRLAKMLAASPIPMNTEQEAKKHRAEIIRIVTEWMDESAR